MRTLRSAALTAVCLGLLSCGGSPATRTTTAAPPAGAPSIPAVVPKPPAPLRPPKPKPPPPGTLPQTEQRPSAESPVFDHQMADLWDGIRANSLSDAMPALFPEDAYVQLKSIGDPRSDFEDRLVADFRLDIGAAHALLGPGARLLGVHVPSGYAHWVPPGVCDNSIGYYEVPNARVVYRQGGGVHSFGIASMISWRGVWYVVHLGSVLRPAAEGLVDDPSVGAGYSAPSSTC